MLHHRIHRLASPAIFLAGGSLKRIAVCFGDGRVEGRVFGVRAVESTPTRVGSYIHLWGERSRDTERTVFGRGYLAKPANQRDIKRGAHTDFIGPIADLATRTGIVFAIGSGYMTRIGGVVGRNTMTDTLAEGLHLIAPASGYPLGGYRSYQHMPQVVFDEEMSLFVGQLF